MPTRAPASHFSNYFRNSVKVIRKSLIRQTLERLVRLLKKLQSLNVFLLKFSKLTSVFQSFFIEGFDVFYPEFFRDYQCSLVFPSFSEVLYFEFKGCVIRSPLSSELIYVFSNFPEFLRFCQCLSVSLSFQVFYWKLHQV